MSHVYQTHQVRWVERFDKITVSLVVSVSSKRDVVWNVVNVALKVCKGIVSDHVDIRTNRHPEGELLSCCSHNLSRL